MNAGEKQDHVAALRALTAVGGAIDAAAPTATENNPLFFIGPGLPTAARAILHKQILDEFFAEKPGVVRDYTAIVMAGPPGAGKSSAQHDHIPPADEGLWRIIDADDFKKRLLKKMTANGQYTGLIPVVVQQRIAEGEPFFAGEFAALVHEESSILAGQAAQRALHRGERVLLDGVNGTKTKLQTRFNELTANGYSKIQFIVVDGPKPVTRARVEHRHITHYDNALGGDSEAAYDARFVPEYVTDALYTAGTPLSSCTSAVIDLMKDAPTKAVDRTATLYEVDTAAGIPQMKSAISHGWGTQVAMTFRGAPAA